MSRIAQYWLRRPWLLSLLLAALTVRALVPTGFMVSASADGLPAFALCSVYAGAERSPSPEQPESPSGQSAGHELCLFSAHAAAAPVPESIVVVRVSVVVTGVPVLPAVPSSASRMVFTHGPRAPPVST